MNCHDLEILLSAYANDELPAAQIVRVNTHLADCAECQATLSAFQAVRRQISALKDISVTYDIKDATMVKIKRITSPAKRWLRRSLVAIPIAALLIALLILQPWVTTPGFQAVMAKSYLAVIALKSYRTEMIMTFPPAANLPSIVNEVAYVAPDRYYTKNSDGTNVEETIIIGENEYYKTTQEGTIPQFINPDSSGLSPDMGNTFRLLNTLHDLQTLKDEVVDGVKCYHYRGTLYLIGNEKQQTIDIWVGKEDNLPRKETANNSYTIRFFDLNKPITIEPPLTPTGDLQPGWHTLQTAPHLTINFSNSIGGEDLAHSTMKYDITLYNDGLQEAKDVHVIIQTMVTNNPVKPMQLEAAPVNNIVPVNIASWQSANFQAEWEFDAGNLSKIELAQLAQQHINIVVTYHAPDGTEFTETYPKTEIHLEQ
jgi:hypothetical protein